MANALSANGGRTSPPVEVIEPASRPEAPISRDYATNVVSGGGIGLAFGAIVALLLGIARRAENTA
jgi:uncharacterized protein involved in exopolysaccharide biosynthesis